MNRNLRQDSAIAVTALVVLLAGMLLRDGPWGPRLGVAALVVVATALVAAVARRDRVLGAIAAIAVTTRAAIALADQIWAFLPKGDQFGYVFLATAAAEAWWQGTTTDLYMSSTVSAYVHFLAPFFFVFGQSLLIPRLLSAMLGMGIVLLLFHIGTRLFDRPAGLAAAAAYAVFPSVAYIQSETLRDPIIEFLVVAIIALCLNGIPMRFTRLMVVGFAIWYLEALRPAALVVLMPALALLALAGMTRLSIPPNESSPGLGAPAAHGRTPSRILFPALVPAGAVAAWIATEYLPRMKDLAALTFYRQQWATGGSSYLTGWVFGRWWDVVLFLPIGAVYFLLTPFPWQIHNALSMLGAIENLVLVYPMMVLALLALPRRRHDPRIVALWAFVLVTAILFGLIEGNIGTALRHRGIVNWAFVLLAGPSLARLYIASRSRIPWLDSLHRASPHAP